MQQRNAKTDLLDVYIFDDSGWKLYTTTKSIPALELVEFIREHGKRAGWFNRNTRQCNYDKAK
jgi:hypothetical protein